MNLENLIFIFLVRNFKLFNSLNNENNKVDKWSSRFTFLQIITFLDPNFDKKYPFLYSFFENINFFKIVLFIENSLFGISDL